MQDLSRHALADPDVRLHYGAGPQQFAELWRPRASAQAPAVIVIHGGFWRSARDLKMTSPLCEALRTEGMACFNVEYRRVGQPGGGYPGTLEDICAAGQYFAAQARKYNIDTARVAVVGHSAGGQLALYLAAERVLKLRGAVSLAGAVDLRRAWELKLGDGAAGQFLGGSPAQVAERYRKASPIERLPLGVPTRLLHGADDEVVPLDLSRRYEAAARASGDDVRLIALPATGHAELIEPAASAWRIISSTLRTLLL